MTPLYLSPGMAIEKMVNWLNVSFSGIFELTSLYLEYFLSKVEYVLLLPHAFIFIALVAIISWRTSGIVMGIFSVIGLGFCWLMNLWDATIATLALIIVATSISLIISIPFGVLSAMNKVVDYITRPIMDLMQTMPPWVYLVPAVILFSLGKTPAVMATAIFSIPPALRLTNLGIRQVSAETVEVGKAFGGSRLQVLTKIQIPMALPTIMMGVNQCIMLSLSMAVLAGLIGAGGLGSEIVRALSRMNIGLGVRSGLCIVVLAIILDRILQGVVDLTSRQGTKVVAEATI